MASGVPVVGANAGGIPSIIHDGVDGILVPPQDPAAMGEAVAGLLRDKERRLAMGQEARAEAERWDWEAATSELRNNQCVHVNDGWHCGARACAAETTICLSKVLFVKVLQTNTDWIIGRLETLPLSPLSHHLFVSPVSNPSLHIFISPSPHRYI